MPVQSSQSIVHEFLDVHISTELVLSEDSLHLVGLLGSDFKLDLGVLLVAAHDSPLGGRA